MSQFSTRAVGPGVPDISWRKQDWAYEQVRNWIITGELAPGARIEQEQLASRLGISRIPLREGLARLIAEGLVSGRPHQQLMVTELTLADARDVYCGREAVESALAAEAATRAGHADIEAIDAILKQQKELLGTGEPEEFRRLDREFHTAIYAMAGMPKTLNAAVSLLAMSERYVRLYLSDAKRSTASFHEHAAIFDAIKKRDSVKAARLTREHVARGLMTLEVSFSDPDQISVHYPSPSPTQTPR